MVKDFNLLIQMLLAPVVVVNHLQYKKQNNMIDIKKWSEMTIVEQEQWRKEQTAQLEAEKLKLAEAMELANKD